MVQSCDVEIVHNVTVPCSGDRNADTNAETQDITCLSRTIPNIQDNVMHKPPAFHSE